jgi:RNA polymerase sigma factor (sigma-70 family)
VEDEDRKLAFCRDAYPKIVGAVALYCGRVDVAEDASQEALARVCLHWGRVSTMDRPLAWAQKVALNQVRSRFRRLVAERRAYARAGADEERHDDPDTAAVLVMRDAIRMLPPRQREAVVWRYYASLSITGAAEVMGCAPGTVQALTAQALQRLREDFLDNATTQGASDA